MEEKEIQKIREKYPISIDEINTYSSFEQILGKNPEDYSPEVRKLRWEKNMTELAKENPDLADYWRYGSEESCSGCIHRDTSANHWCTLQELPCMYNPVLKMLGMACYGAGKTISVQYDLFDN
ncbi:hypothetical protein SAMN05421741_11842 [Paenimyroides ummariense]|uniref:Uncharacterized protein n=1 Tax=Paenimyroides ummariense TaxID=913024 RepID=A0A1I5E136_9FLAO|nr:hypothetical protein [Paenimyroides ummariense]SFO05244.1 hypothetical protein SAMN05421741_11842 [Paenimyroides ummariense]